MRQVVLEPVETSDLRRPVKTFVINLDEDRARLAAIDNEFKRLGLTYERFPALRPDSLPAWLREQFFDADGTPYSPLTPGEIGCYASHLAVMRKVLDEAGPALVLEDDVVFDPELVQVLANLHRLPNDWEIVRCSNPPKSSFLSSGQITPRTEVIRYWRIPMGATAYFINRKGAERVLAGAKRRVRPVDNDLRRFWLFDLKTYGLLPLPIHWVDSRSAIDRFGKRPRGEKKQPRFAQGRRFDPVRARLEEFGLLISLRCMIADMKAAFLGLFGVKRRYSPSLRVGSRF